MLSVLSISDVMLCINCIKYHSQIIESKGFFTIDDITIADPKRYSLWTILFDNSHRW